MKPIETWIDKILTKYTGTQWKTLAGAIAWIVLWVVGQLDVGLSPDIMELLTILASGLVVGGVYHKGLVATRQSQEAKYEALMAKKMAEPVENIPPADTS